MRVEEVLSKLKQLGAEGIPPPHVPRGRVGVGVEGLPSTVESRLAHETPTLTLPLGTGGGEEEFPAKANAHIHLPPNFSAFATVGQAVDLAAQQGVSVLGASNYYDYDVYGEFGKLALARGIYPLFGLEIIAMSQPLRATGVKINDPGNPGKIYVCGKGITRFAPMNAEASRLLSDAFGQDEKFYQFYRALQTYKRSLADSGATLLLTPTSAFLRLMTSGPEAPTTGQGGDK